MLNDRRERRLLDKYYLNYLQPVTKSDEKNICPLENFLHSIL